MSLPDDANMLWPLPELRRGTEALLSSCGFVLGADGLPSFSPKTEEDISEWLVHGPQSVGIQGSVKVVPKSELLAALVVPGPTVVSCAVRAGAGGVTLAFLIVERRGWRCRVLCRDGSDFVCPTAELAERVDVITAAGKAEFSTLFSDLPAGARILDRIYKAERLDGLPISVVAYHRDGTAPLLEQFKDEGGRRGLLTFLSVSLLQIVLTTAAALTLGNSIVNGVVDTGRIHAWALIAAADIPLTYWSASLLASLSISAGIALKRRLLEGAFFIADERLRRQGYGETLARLNEASVIERTSIAETLGLVAPLVMWCAAAYVFSTSGYAMALVAVQLVFMVLVAWITRGLVRTYGPTYTQRLHLTEQVIDNIIGHRTRAVQQNPSVRHIVEDRRLAEYATSLRLNDRYRLLGAALGRAWLFSVGGVLAYAFVRGALADELLLMGIGIFLGSRALSGYSSALERAVAWFSAYRAIEPLITAGRTRERPRRQVETDVVSDGMPTALAASSISFSYRKGGRPIFRDASLRLARGERVLIEGSSGGGKTTFAKLIAGELQAQGGSLLVAGMDPSTASENQWRELVASAPQFHENYVFTNTFAFNVDPRRGRAVLSPHARQICEELGLGPILAKMPAGPAQLLGETGWQLSHGERSRIFIARALLQDARIVVFDESFGALDPITLAHVLECVRRRSPTLLVIAHV